MELAFVLARRQNRFFAEIAEAVRDELEQLGVRSSVHHDAFPPQRDDLVYVVMPPHEFFALAGRSNPPSVSQLRRTVFIGAEQPGTPFFEDDVRLAPLAGAVFDINALTVGQLNREGIAARHFPLGWTRSWSALADGPDGVEFADDRRDTDVLHLGIVSDNRSRALAAGGRWLAQHRCRLVLGDDDRPNDTAKCNFVVDEAKWDLLARARILLNVHVAGRPYFEWLRVVQAISNGCAVVSEHAVGTEPLHPGAHFLAGRAEVVGLMAHGLLRDEAGRAAMARAAYRFLRDELPFSRAVGTLVEAAHDLLGSAPAAQAPAGPATLPPLLSLTADELEAATRDARYPSAVTDEDSSVLRAALKDTRLEMLALRREIDRWRTEAERGTGVPDVEAVAESAAYRRARPRISVITPLYDHERHVEAALGSIVDGSYADVELIVVDDGSSDGSLAAVRRFLGRHGRTVPMLVLRHPVNRGLGYARNTAVAFARGELAFMLDADNVVYRHGLDRLVEALDSDPGADFAYGMLEMFSGSGAVGLRSALPWEPWRLRRANFVDAMALWRLAALRDLGGFTTDRRLHGWEDYDLWCRAAERERRGVHVQEIVARYRVSRHSMLALTDISSTAAVSLLAERYPRLMAGVEPPL